MIPPCPSLPFFLFSLPDAFPLLCPFPFLPSFFSFYIFFLLSFLPHSNHTLNPHLHPLLASFLPSYNLPPNPSSSLAPRMTPALLSSLPFQPSTFLQPPKQAPLCPPQHAPLCPLLAKSRHLPCMSRCLVTFPSEQGCRVRIFGRSFVSPSLVYYVLLVPS